MIPKNCLSDTLDRLHIQGGYAVFRASNHWQSCHAMHFTTTGILTSYVPSKPLDHPMHALFGFEGHFTDIDESPASPVPLRSMVMASWMLAVGVTAWAVARWWRGVWA